MLNHLKMRMKRTGKLKVWPLLVPAKYLNKLLVREDSRMLKKTIQKRDDGEIEECVYDRDEDMRLESVQ